MAFASGAGRAAVIASLLAVIALSWAWLAAMADRLVRGLDAGDVGADDGGDDAAERPAQLIRVVVDRGKDGDTVVTVYRTSKVRKYWRDE